MATLAFFRLRRLVLGLFLVVSFHALPQAAGQVTPAPPAEKSSSNKDISSTFQTNGHEEELDRVVAVVNSRVILASDLELEMRIYHLLPIGQPSDYTPPKALERLISRALIEQQILLEDPNGLEVASKDVSDSLTELQQNLPDCRHRDCASEAGWQTYLGSLDLTPERVQSYWAARLAILRFIEQRFRSGIRITPEQIQKYYQEDLLPRYARPEDAPSLSRLSDRIQEILLQQQVNALMDDWLKSLQTQGQVEVLDAALRTVESTETPTPAEETRPASPSALPSKVSHDPKPTRDGLPSGRGGGYRPGDFQ